MSKDRQRQRALRAEQTVPVPAIVATGPGVTTGPTVAAKAPEFPGVDESALPIYDSAVAAGFAHLEAQDAEATTILAEPFQPWGLDDVAPVPLTFMIQELRRTVGDGLAWAVEQEVGADIVARRLIKGEVNDDDSNGPAGDADVADPAGGPAVVDGDGGRDPRHQAAG